MSLDARSEPASPLLPGPRSRAHASTARLPPVESSACVWPSRVEERNQVPGVDVGGSHEQLAEHRLPAAAVVQLGAAFGADAHGVVLIANVGSQRPQLMLLDGEFLHLCFVG